MSETPTQIQEDFHRSADEKRYLNRLQNPHIRIREEKIASLLLAKTPPNGRVLEVGCGEGSNLHYLIAAGPGRMFFGLDFSLEKAAFCGQNVSGAPTICGDATALPLKDSSFDMVLLRDLLHHVHWAKDEVLKEAARTLKPGGIIAVMESDGNAFINKVFRLFFAAERGMKDSTKDKLEALTTKFGDVEWAPLEAGFLVRAFAFFAGPPSGLSGLVTRPIYFALELVEKLAERLKPKSNWAYNIICIRPGDK